MSSKNKLSNVNGICQRNIKIDIPEDSFALISYYSMINNEKIETSCYVILSNLCLSSSPKF